MFVAQEASCRKSSCETTGEWRTDDGRATITDAWVPGELEEGTELATQGFPGAGWSRVYPLDYGGDMWLPVLAVVLGAGALLSLGGWVVVWVLDIKTKRGSRGWLPATFYVRARGSDVERWAARHGIPGHLRELPGGWTVLGTYQRRGVLAGVDLDARTALVELGSLGREPYLVDQRTLSALRADGGVQATKRPAVLPWEADDRRVRRRLVAVPAPYPRVPRRVAEHAIKGRRWLVVPNAEPGDVLGRPSDKDRWVLVLTVQGEEVRLRVFDLGAFEDEWTWNLAPRMVNEDRIPGGVDGEALRDLFDLTQVDVVAWEYEWPEHVDQQALQAVVDMRGSSTEVVDALIETLDLPDGTRSLLLATKDR